MIPHNLEPEIVNALSEPDPEQSARKVHILLFPEEYDFQYDSIADANDRRRGKNPMSQDYVSVVNARRMRIGFDPFGSDGLPATNETMEFVRRQISDGVKRPRQLQRQSSSSNLPEGLVKLLQAFTGEMG